MSEAKLADWEVPDVWLDDGADVALAGRTLRAIHTPGHTWGHLVFADEAGGLLFAGDHVLPTITPSIGLEAAPPPSPLADFLTSLQLLTTRPDTALLPAHGGVGMRVHERVDALLAQAPRRAAGRDACGRARGPGGGAGGGADPAVDTPGAPPGRARPYGPQPGAA